jgi:hypothetical protein
MYALFAIMLLMQSYDCQRATAPIVIDGKADEAAWANAAWTSDFVDIEGDAKPKPAYRTRAKMLWDDAALYVYAELEEPHVWGTLRERNAIIYNDNDFEVFIDPDGDTLNYYELEVNALNTVMELTLDKPYYAGGNYTFVTSKPLKTAVHVDGTLNDPRDVDKGWNVEMAIPWTVLGNYRGNDEKPPTIGSALKINFSRVQWQHRVVNGKYVKVPKAERNEDNWVWSPIGVIDMHRPERWGVVKFVD